MLFVSFLQFKALLSVAVLFLEKRNKRLMFDANDTFMNLHSVEMKNILGTVGEAKHNRRIHKSVT